MDDTVNPSFLWTRRPDALVSLYPTEEELSWRYPGPLTRTSTGVRLLGSHPFLGVAIEADPIADSDDWAVKLWSLESPVPSDRESCLLALSVLIALEPPHQVTVISPRDYQYFWKFVTTDHPLSYITQQEGGNTLGVLLREMEKERTRRQTNMPTGSTNCLLFHYTQELFGSFDESCSASWNGYRLEMGFSLGEAWMHVYSKTPGTYYMLWGSHVIYKKEYEKLYGMSLYLGEGVREPWFIDEGETSEEKNLVRIFSSAQSIRDLSSHDFASLFCFLTSKLDKAPFPFLFFQYIPPRPGLTGFFACLPDEDILELRDVRARTVEEARKDVLRKFPGAYSFHPVDADSRIYPEAFPDFKVTHVGRQDKQAVVDVHG